MGLSALGISRRWSNGITYVLRSVYGEYSTAKDRNIQGERERERKRKHPEGCGRIVMRLAASLVLRLGSRWEFPSRAKASHVASPVHRLFYVKSNFTAHRRVYRLLSRKPMYSFFVRTILTLLLNSTWGFSSLKVNGISNSVLSRCSFDGNTYFYVMLTCECTRALYLWPTSEEWGKT